MIRLRPQALSGIFAAMAALLLIWASGASAHNLNNGYSYVTFEGDTIRYELLVPFPLLLKYDADGDYLLTDQELAPHRDEIGQYMQTHLELFNNELRMDFHMTEMKTVIQEMTEDPMVRFVFDYVSQMEIGSITILYNLFFEDKDIGVGHQNYIQLLQDGNLMQHWVVEQGMGTIRYIPSEQGKFNPKAAGKLAVYGMQQALRSVAAWLFLLWAAIAATGARAGAKVVLIHGLYSVVGYVAADRLRDYPWNGWLGPAALVVLGVILAYAVFKRSMPHAGTTAALLGIAAGAPASATIAQFEMGAQFKLVSMGLYEAGLLAAMLGIVYELKVIPFGRAARLLRVNRLPGSRYGWSIAIAAAALAAAWLHV
jgi:hypothetical protein